MFGEMALTAQRLGTMIGANREAVTRAFGLLQDEGVVELRRRRIYVEDMEELRQVAEYDDTHDAALLARSSLTLHSPG